MDLYFIALKGIFNQSGFAGLTWGNVVMLLVAFVLLYLAIVKGFEPLLLVGFFLLPTYSPCFGYFLNLLRRFCIICARSAKKLGVLRSKNALLLRATQLHPSAGLSSPVPVLETHP